MRKMNMVTDNLCHRILLAKNQSCKVIYCEECDVTELEIGAISLRLASESIEQLYAVLKEANDKLIAYKKFKNQDDNILYLLLTQETTMYGYILSLLRYIFGESFMKKS